MPKVKVNKIGDKLNKDFENALRQTHEKQANKLADKIEARAKMLLNQTIRPSPRLRGMSPPEIKEVRLRQSGLFGTNVTTGKRSGKRLTSAIPKVKKQIKYVKGKGIEVTVTVFVSDNGSNIPHLAWHMLNGGMNYTYTKDRIVPMVGSRQVGHSYKPRTRANPSSGIGTLNYSGPRSDTIRFRTMRAGDKVNIKPRHFYKIVAVRVQRDMLNRHFKEWEHDVSVIADKL